MRLDAIRDAVWPRLQTDAEINPGPVFARYTRALATLDPNRSSVLDKQLLDFARNLFDDASARRTEINSAADAVLSANGIVVSLIVGIGIGSLKDLMQAERPDVVAIYLFFAISLVFLGRAIVSAFRVGNTFRNTLGPDDIAPLPSALHNGVSPYDRAIARKLIGYSIDNYKINNIERRRLAIAKVSLRNGIVVIIVGGIAVATYSLISLLLHPVAALQGI